MPDADCEESGWKKPRIWNLRVQVPDGKVEEKPPKSTRQVQEGMPVFQALKTRWSSVPQQESSREGRRGRQLGFEGGRRTSRDREWRINWRAQHRGFRAAPQQTVLASGSSEVPEGRNVDPWLGEREPEATLIDALEFDLTILDSEDEQPPLATQVQGSNIESVVTVRADAIYYDPAEGEDRDSSSANVCDGEVEIEVEEEVPFRYPGVRTDSFQFIASSEFVRGVQTAELFDAQRPDVFVGPPFRRGGRTNDTVKQESSMGACSSETIDVPPLATATPSLFRSNDIRDLWTSHLKIVGSHGIIFRVRRSSDLEPWLHMPCLLSGRLDFWSAFGNENCASLSRGNFPFFR